MKLVVTGGAGFIGSNFIRYILARHPRYTIRDLDKLTYSGNLHTLRDVGKNKRHTFVRGDICDRRKVQEVLKGVDAVVHFAAESHVDRSILDSTAFVKTNVLGTQCLLDAARHAGVKRFVLVSTDEVYGSAPTGEKFTEESLLAPNSPYAASKAGLLGFTRALALDLAPEKITVNGISPGPVATEMNAPLIQDPELNQQFISKIPLGRWGKVEEVGHLAVYLCSEDAGFITGTDILIAGGWTAQ